MCFSVGFAQILSYRTIQIPNFEHHFEKQRPVGGTGKLSVSFCGLSYEVLLILITSYFTGSAAGSVRSISRDISRTEAQ